MIDLLLLRPEIKRQVARAIRTSGKRSGRRSGCGLTRSRDPGRAACGALTSPGGCDSIHPADSCIPEITPTEPFACADSPGPLTRRSRRLLTVLLTLVLAAPAIAQSKGDKWVATWATALVSRPLPGPTGWQVPEDRRPARRPRHRLLRQHLPAPAGRGSSRPRCPAAPGGGRGFVPPATVNNQTLRQVVRTSVGGSRVRVVLSNAFGTAPIEIGARQRRAARQGRLDRRGVVEAADVRRRAHGLDPRRRDARERSGGSGAGAAVGSGDRSLRARRSRREPVAGHDAQRRVADELRLRGRATTWGGHDRARAAARRMVPPRRAWR